ncbi:uncharacterized protein LOC108673332 [Hyalella azteca]|uniref:Uncharacterized protein LOC108673332 n=1 Tax=Hyalella azteca TaxID=294128 RepID=A0A8B7NUH7_HYAAZ|nr:uncharacterized protein LOC108673332 [Hyalella azteca]XP_047741506.1 uncharacterized protein LOC108673332 [Hyalella azteca]
MAASISTYHLEELRSSDAHGIRALDKEIVTSLPKLGKFISTGLQRLASPTQVSTAVAVTENLNIFPIRSRRPQSWRNAKRIKRDKSMGKKFHRNHGLFINFNKGHHAGDDHYTALAPKALPVAEAAITDVEVSVKTTTPSIESLMPSKIIPSLPPHLRDMTTTTPLPAVFFNNSFISNVTAQLGQSVFLPCRTKHSSDRKFIPQVSWVRRRDWHILTSGTVTYTKEQRYDVHHPEGSTEWTLVIKYVKLQDAGTYECQLMSGGGLVSHLVHLTVVEPKAVIPGNGEYHVDSGTTISLTCYVEQSRVAPLYIFWYHDSRMINYDQERGGVVVHMETEPRVMSRLTIADARPSDSGNYTCDADNTLADSISVYITAGNKIAALHPRDVDVAAPLYICRFLVLALAALPLMLRHFLEFCFGFQHLKFKGKNLERCNYCQRSDFTAERTSICGSGADRRLGENNLTLVVGTATST